MLGKLKISYHQLGNLPSFLLSPKSKDKDLARREFILNILLLGSIVLSFIANIYTWIDEFRTPTAEKIHYIGSSEAILIIFVIFLVEYLISRSGRSLVAAYSLVGIYFFGAIYTVSIWGADVPQALLTFALVIVLAGILISTRFAFLMTIISGASLGILTFLQTNSLYNPVIYWKSKKLTMGDTIVSVVTLTIIAIVSWLYNSEIERALKRVWRSEAALRKQKDNLEITVEKRTQQLKQTQVEKIAQLYRFAEFGRSASGLFHDLVNPLTLVSLNLNKLNRKIEQPVSEAEVALERAISGTKRLENFIQAARRQMQSQEIIQKFSLTDEINQAIQMLEHKAKKAQIKISLIYKQDIKSLGNPIKFNQLISNLISNAIDAYDKTRKSQKQIEVRVDKTDSQIRVEVQDWGSGIKGTDLPKIFDPLFTTKSFAKGTGIGLSICKEIVEKNLKGKITVASKKGLGTTFTVEFPIKN